MIIVLKNKPSQKELDQISKRAGTNWRSLLTQLGEDSTTVEGFLLSPSSNTIEACFKGLVHWLEGNADEPVTWETLLKALRDADMKGYADGLEKKLKGYARYKFALCSTLDNITLYYLWFNIIHTSCTCDLNNNTINFDFL